MYSIDKKLIRFFVLTIGMYIIWYTLYEFFLKPWGWVDHLITENVTRAICFLLNLMGYESYYTIALKLGETYIYLAPDPRPVLRVGASCNGLELFVLYIIFMISYPGEHKMKIVFMLITLTVIHLLNILRNYILALMAIEHSPFYDLFHRYVFIFIVYGCIFVFWLLWANKYSKMNLKDVIKK